MTIDGWNVLVYAIARGAAEQERVRRAIEGMHAALTTDRCNIGIQLHTRSETTRIWISSGRGPEQEAVANLDASAASSLTQLLDVARRRLPRRRTALIVWEHSSGLDHVHDHDAPVPRSGRGGHRAPPRRRAGEAKHAGHLGGVGVRQAIAGSVARRVDILGLNACWMASLEVEYELRGVAEIQIASQGYALPWPYPAVIGKLAADPSMSARQLAKQIVACVQTEIDMAEAPRGDSVSALVSGAAIDALATAFDTYARQVRPLIDANWGGVVDSIMSEVWRVDDPYQADLISLVRQLGKRDPSAGTAAAAVVAAYDAMIVARAASGGHAGAHGLSVFCPKTTHLDLEDAYRRIEFKSNAWTEVLSAVQRKLAAAQPAA